MEIVGALNKDCTDSRYQTQATVSDTTWTETSVVVVTPPLVDDSPNVMDVTSS